MPSEPVDRVFVEVGADLSKLQSGLKQAERLTDQSVRRIEARRGGTAMLGLPPGRQTLALPPGGGAIMRRPADLAKISTRGGALARIPPIQIPLIIDADETLRSAERKVKDSSRRMRSSVAGIGTEFRGITKGLLLGGAAVAGLTLGNAAIRAFKGDAEGAAEALERLPLGLGMAVREINTMRHELSGAREEMERMGRLSQAQRVVQSEIAHQLGGGISLRSEIIGIQNDTALIGKKDKERELIIAQQQHDAEVRRADAFIEAEAARAQEVKAAAKKEARDKGLSEDKGALSIDRLTVRKEIAKLRERQAAGLTTIVKGPGRVLQVGEEIEKLENKLRAIEGVLTTLEKVTDGSIAEEQAKELKKAAKDRLSRITAEIEERPDKNRFRIQQGTRFDAPVIGGMAIPVSASRGGAFGSKRLVGGPFDKFGGSGAFDPSSTRLSFPEGMKKEAARQSKQNVVDEAVKQEVAKSNATLKAILSQLGKGVVGVMAA